MNCLDYFIKLGITEIDNTAMSVETSDNKLLNFLIMLLIIKKTSVMTLGNLRVQINCIGLY